MVFYVYGEQMSINSTAKIINIMYNHVPFFNSLKETAHKLGAEIYFVGGCVRDVIRGEKAYDWDIVPFNVDYVKFAHLLSKQIRATAVPFKDNMRLAKGNFVCDVSKPRGSNIYQDLLKRDFTINNLAIDLDGSLIGNPAHIEKGLIKAVHTGVFDDDPLRIMRAFRFVSTLGFSIDEETYSLIKEKSHLLSLVASERITEELRKTSAGKFVSESMKLFEKSGVLKEIFKDCTLDFNSPLGLKNISFPLWIGALAGKNAAKALKLSSKEEKLLFKVTDNLNDAAFLHNKTYDERRTFIWKNYPFAEAIFDFAQCKFPEHQDLINESFNLINTLFPEKAKLISGAHLMKAGFTPGPLFGKIIEEIALKLALGELEADNISQYLINNFGGKK